MQRLGAAAPNDAVSEGQPLVQIKDDSERAALAAGQEGGHHPRFARELLLSLSVPDGALLSPYETASQMRALADGLRRSLQGCRILVRSVDAAISESAF